MHVFVWVKLLIPSVCSFLSLRARKSQIKSEGEDLTVSVPPHCSILNIDIQIFFIYRLLKLHTHSYPRLELYPCSIIFFMRNLVICIYVIQTLCRFLIISVQLSYRLSRSFQYAVYIVYRLFGVFQTNNSETGVGEAAAYTADSNQKQTKSLSECFTYHIYCFFFLKNRF